ncbi:hypothetical protein C8J57DRAFT_1440281 [Mycena rebaudengoi]|nr:hypothetical protein C8J57DRAFT_1440281 [Mycena rebaudengoi]
MDAAGTLLTFFISVEPSTGRPSPGKYTFRLSLKVNDVERPIGEPASLLLGVDPRTLEFAVFVFPGKKNVLPAGGLYSLRVWLRVGGIDHRVFGEDDLWLGKDLDFHAVADASFARLRSVTHDTQVYDAVVGRAKVQFIVRWKHVSARLYKYSMEYEAGGVGATLIDDLRLILDSDPRRVTFLIYSIPIPSMPRGASHHLRVWLKSFVPPVPEDSPVFNDSYVYQRLWKSDTFKIGGRLDFEALGPKLIMGVSGGRPQTVAVEVEARLQRIRELPLVGYQPDSKVYNG